MNESKLYEEEYYKENPSYSDVDCFRCRKKTMRLKGIESSEECDIQDKTLYECEICSQQAYIEVEWLFTITL